MTKVTVKFEIEVPDNVDSDLLHEWLRFNLCDNGSMSKEASELDNLIANGVEPIFGTFEWDYV